MLKYTFLVDTHVLTHSPRQDAYRIIKSGSRSSPNCSCHFGAFNDRFFFSNTQGSRTNCTVEKMSKRLNRLKFHFRESANTLLFSNCLSSFFTVSHTPIIIIFREFFSRKNSFCVRSAVIHIGYHRLCHMSIYVTGVHNEEKQRHIVGKNASSYADKTIKI